MSQSVLRIPPKQDTTLFSQVCVSDVRHKHVISYFSNIYGHICHLNDQMRHKPIYFLKRKFYWLPFQTRPDQTILYVCVFDAACLFHCLYLSCCLFFLSLLRLFLVLFVILFVYVSLFIDLTCFFLGIICTNKSCRLR